MATTDARMWRRSLPRLAGELVVIVLGVMIALWADGWAQRRAEREIEASRISALRDNVAATRGRLEAATAEAAGASAALERVAYWEAIPALNPENEQVLLEGFLFGPSFTPEMNVYMDLKSSGDLALLRSTGLRQALAAMDATLEELRLIQDDLTRVQQLNYDPFILRYFSLDGRFAANLGLEGLPRSPADITGDPRVLRNLALFKLDLVALLMENLEDASGALDRVDEALDGALR